MLLVKTYVDKSPISGLGLYAAQFIPAGTVIWKFVPGFDLKFTKEEVERFPEVAQSFIRHYQYLSRGTSILCLDDARFFNHSDHPNTTEHPQKDEESETIASRDIQKGEEITSNYSTFDEDTSWKLTEDHAK